MKTYGMKEINGVKELYFNMRFQAWKRIKIIIKDEDLFKKKCEEFLNENIEYGDYIDFFDLENSDFNDCVEIEHGDMNFDDTEYENYYDVMEDNNFKIQLS